MTYIITHFFIKIENNLIKTELYVIILSIKE